MVARSSRSSRCRRTATEKRTPGRDRSGRAACVREARCRSADRRTRCESTRSARRAVRLRRGAPAPNFDDVNPETGPRGPRCRTHATDRGVGVDECLATASAGHGHRLVGRRESVPHVIGSEQTKPLAQNCHRGQTVPWATAAAVGHQGRSLRFGPRQLKRGGDRRHLNMSAPATTGIPR